MTQPTEMISGVFRQFLFGPKGGVEGVLLSVKRKIVQVSMSPKEGVAVSHSCKAGKTLRMLGARDNSRRTAAVSTHPVYEFESLADASGERIESRDADANQETIVGSVAALHYAKHGQPNGVVLDTGEFIHMGPEGMALAGLCIGSAVKATGRLGLTVINTRWLDAVQINGIELR